MEKMYIEFVDFKNETKEQFIKVDKRFDEVNERFTKIDENFARIDERFTRIDERFTRIDEKFARIDERFDEVNGRIDGVDERLTIINKRLTRIEKESNKNTIAIESMDKKLKQMAEVQEAHYVENKREHKEIDFNKQFERERDAAIGKKPCIKFSD
jgi:chromosome segregation ATPase